VRQYGRSAILVRAWLLVSIRNNNHFLATAHAVTHLWLSFRQTMYDDRRSSSGAVCDYSHVVALTMPDNLTHSLNTTHQRWMTECCNMSISYNHKIPSTYDIRHRQDMCTVSESQRESQLIWLTTLLLNNSIYWNAYSTKLIQLRLFLFFVYFMCGFWPRFSDLVQLRHIWGRCLYAGQQPKLTC